MERRWFLAGLRPIESVWTDEGLLELSKYDWEGHRMVAGLEYLKWVYFGRGEIHELRQKEFDAEFARLRKRRDEGAIDRDIAIAAFRKRSLPGSKDPRRIVEKAMEDYGGQFGYVLDILSDVMVFEDLSKLLAYEEENLGNEEVVRVVNRFDHPLPCGYSDIIMNLGLPNGFVSELRLVTRPVFELWDQHQAVAAEVDGIVAQARAGMRGLTREETAVVRELLEDLRRNYLAAKGEAS